MQIDTSVAPLLIDVPNPLGSVALIDLDIGNGTSPNGLEIRNTQIPVIAENLVVQTSPGSDSVVIDLSVAVALQSTEGNELLRITSSLVRLADSSFPAVSADPTSDVATAVTSLGASPPATIEQRSGATVRMNAPPTWDVGESLTLSFEGPALGAASVFLSPDLFFFDFNGQGNVDMPVLLDPTLLFNLTAIPVALDAAGSGAVTIPALDPAIFTNLGDFNLQPVLVTTPPGGPRVRLGNLRTLLVVPSGI